MNKKNRIIGIVVVIVILALVLEFTRTEFLARFSGDESAELLNPKELIQQTVDEELFESLARNRYLIVTEPTSDAFTEISNNFQKLFQYIDSDYDVVDVNQLSTVSSDYTGIIMIVDDYDLIKPVDELMEYAFDGGHLFFAYRPLLTSNFYRMSRKLGIMESSDYLNTTGIRFEDNLLIGGLDYESDDKHLITNTSLLLQLTEDSELLAETSESVPLVWEKTYGYGSVLFYNGSNLGSKVQRGMILGILSKMEEHFVYPVMNTKTFYLDDFPAPIPGGNHPKIDREFGRPIAGFYREIWLPDMLEIAARYRLIYTGVIIGTYDDDVTEPSLEELVISKRELLYFGNEVLKHGGELGIHGYNHQPFFLGELYSKDLPYIPWPDADTIKQSLDIINTYGIENFPKYRYKVYVPPSNIIYPEGRKALVEANTDLKVIASLYDTGGSRDAYSQEFELAEDGIVEMPRFTSGYWASDETVWLILNGISVHGVFSHFIHPDDILDEYRTGDVGWESLIRSFDELNELVYDKFPWLRDMTASEAANEVIRYDLADVRYEKTKDSVKIYVNNFNKELYLILRSEKSIEKVIECTAKRIDEEIYLIKLKGPISEIQF